jgi:hypothetical protein
MWNEQSTRTSVPRSGASLGDGRCTIFATEDGKGAGAAGQHGGDQESGQNVLGIVEVEHHIRTNDGRYK